MRVILTILLLVWMMSLYAQHNECQQLENLQKKIQELGFEKLNTNGNGQDRESMFASFGDTGSIHSLQYDADQINDQDPVCFALSVDPLAEKFPSMNPYNAMGNDPVNMIDPDGMAPKKSEVISLNEFKKRFGSVPSLTVMETEFNQRDKMAAKYLDAKRDFFLYSERWGFIDLKHFTNC